jgi:hypothetical protein
MDPEFQRLATEYQRLADESLADPTKMEANVEKMKTINASMASILDRTIQEMNTGIASDVDRQRNELIQKLVRIQKDYNGLPENTDKLETLRRIRGFQETDWQSQLKTYIIVLAVLAVVLLLFVFFRRQKVFSTMTAPTSAISTPALTY